MHCRSQFRSRACPASGGTIHEPSAGHLSVSTGSSFLPDSVPVCSLRRRPAEPELCVSTACRQRRSVYSCDMELQQSVEYPWLGRNQFHQPVLHRRTAIQLQHRFRLKMRAPGNAAAGNNETSEATTFHRFRKRFRLPERETYTFARNRIDRSRSVANQRNISTSHRAKGYIASNRSALAPRTGALRQALAQNRELASESIVLPQIGRPGNHRHAHLIGRHWRDIDLTAVAPVNLHKITPGHDCEVAAISITTGCPNDGIETGPMPHQR